MFLKNVVLAKFGRMEKPVMFPQSSNLSAVLRRSILSEAWHGHAARAQFFVCTGDLNLITLRQP